ncbi:MAG: universal stress protein [Pseudomonadota bacterium]
MIKYQHVLVASDLTDGSDIVIKKAEELAKQMGSHLSLLHVVEPLPGYGYAFVGSAEIELQLVEEAKRQLAKLGKQLNVKEGDQYVEIGPTKIEITRVAEEIGVDLIIVGSHGRHGLSNLLGSTANAVVHNANCDVLTIRLK